METSYDFEVGFSRMLKESGGFEEGIAVIHIGCPHGGGARRGAERRFVLINYVF